MPYMSKTQLDATLKLNTDYQYNRGLVDGQKKAGEELKKALYHEREKAMVNLMNAAGQFQQAITHLIMADKNQL